MQLRLARTRASLAVQLAVSLLLTAGCSTSSTSITPSTANTNVNAINMAGSWSGTLESANLPTQNITAIIVQGGTCVDGAWASSTSDWNGAISGYAGEASYSGQFSFDRADGNSRCTASGTVSGSVTADTITWTGTGLTAVSPCRDPLPQSIVITLRRRP